MENPETTPPVLPQTPTPPTAPAAQRPTIQPPTPPSAFEPPVRAVPPTPAPSFAEPQPPTVGEPMAPAFPTPSVPEPPVPTARGEVPPPPAGGFGLANHGAAPPVVGAPGVSRPVTPSPAALPPSGPPSVVARPPSGDDPSERNRGGSWGWRALLAFIAGGVVAAAGFGAAIVAADSGDGNDEIETETAQPETTTIKVESGENAAATVARILGPSVVQIETDLGVGSGVVYGDGLILTNHHVIADASVVRVRASDGRSFDGTIVGSDPAVDIAVVQVASSDLPVAELAPEHSVEVGEVAVAIGSPFELQQTVTQGIVSAVNRPMVSGESITAMIQTDAPINPGNSGGALADADGRVVGINTAIRTDGVSSSNAGIGFAVPIHTALDTAERILSGESLTPAFLGVSGEADPNGDAGVVVTEVTAGSGAAIAGLQVGDRILSFDGAPVTELFELAGLVRANRPGDVVTFEIVRDGERQTLEATLGEAPDGN